MIICVSFLFNQNFRNIQKGNEEKRGGGLEEGEDFRLLE
jgi:hypothetical protein